MLAKLAFANVRKSAKDFAVYFFTLVLGIAVFYAFNSIAGSDAVARISEDTRQMVELLGMVISGVSLFIAAILAFLVIYANRFLIKRRNKEFALYLTLGMRKGDLLKVSALETCIVGTLSLVVGLALGVWISQVLSNVAASMFDTAVEGVSFSISAETLVYTVAVFAVIFFVTVALNTGYLFKAKLIDLLHGDRKNEVLTLRSLPLSFVLFCRIVRNHRHFLQASDGQRPYERQRAVHRRDGSGVRGDRAVLLFAFRVSAPSLPDDKTAVSARVEHVLPAPAFCAREFRVRVHERDLADAFSCHHQRMRRHRHLQRDGVGGRKRDEDD